MVKGGFSRFQCIIARIITFAVVVIIGSIIYWITLPAMNFQSIGFYVFLFAMAVIAAVCFRITEKAILWEDYSNFGLAFGAIATFIVVIMLICGIASCKMFNWRQYQSLIEIEEGNFNTDIVTAETSNLPVVDVATATKLGDRTIAELANSTWYDVDNEYNFIIYQGEHYRISPINYGGFFKYLKGRHTGIPGYVLVNVYTQEATLVQSENPIFYSPSASFSYNLTRHLRREFRNDIFGNSFFEIDEEGNPYWITSVRTPTIGVFGGALEEEFIITNATTGECKKYKTDELPEWVDHAYDLGYLMQLVYYNYRYVNGWFNPSKTGVNQISYQYRDTGFAGYNTTVSSDGVVFFTGVTPANAAESILGFILANPRTGVVKYYSCYGAEESSAQAAAEGLVQNLQYKATYPTMINVDGEPTYFMALKDNAGLIQRYALCNVENYTKVVEAKTLEEALESYRKEIGVEVVASEEMTESTTGVINAVYTAEIDGYTYFYFTLTGDNKSLYMSSIENSNRQVLLIPGMTVEIAFTPTYESNVYLVKEIIF